MDLSLDGRRKTQGSEHILNNLLIHLAGSLSWRGDGCLGPADGGAGRGLLLQHRPVERVVILVVQGTEQDPE